MKEKKRQRSLAAIAFSFALVLACAELPPKPEIPFCTIDLPRNQAICVLLTDQQANKLQGLSKTEIQQVIDDLPDETKWKEPLENFDRAVVFKPDHWGEVAKYQRKLRDYAQTQCKK
jgi:hypothetical protein